MGSRQEDRPAPSEQIHFQALVKFDDTFNHVIRNEILSCSTSTRIRTVARKEAALVTMPEDGFYKALKGVTTLDEVMRVVYRNDCDGITPLSVEELIARCERTN